VIEAMGRAMREHFANPSSLHGLGAAAARALATAREEVAALIHAAPEEIIFTGSGTEANALGVLGAARASRLRHLVVSAIEHAAVFNSARMLADDGWQVDTVSPEANGCVTVDAVLAAVRPETSVVAIMLVNNEIGTLQPVADIARALRALGRKIHFHVDAVQFAGLEPLDVRTKGADSIAISAHKLHGPKGIGALWLRKGKRLAPLYGGGGQERDLRSGTENLPAAVGFGVAAAQARKGQLRPRPACASCATGWKPSFSPLSRRPGPRCPCPRRARRTSRAFFCPVFPPSRSCTRWKRAAFSPPRARPARRMPANKAASSKRSGLPQPRRLRFSLSRLTTADDVEQAARALALSITEVGRVVNPTR
jgi:cysteine sulfinate desulfinase/cysteine desulfurase-like protein